MGSAPNDVKGSNELQHELDKVHGEQIKHNNEKRRQKVGKLRDSGAFRIPLARNMWERVDAPKFSGEVHEVVSFKGANVSDGKNSFPVKTVLAVLAGSRDIDFGDAGPAQGRRAQQREMLQDFARDLKDLLPSAGYTLARVGQLIRGFRGAIDTMDVYGPARQGRIVSFLKLFPKMFSLTGNGAKIMVFPAAAPEITPPKPRPAEVGGARSSDAPGPAERMPRAPELDPRAQYRRFLNDMVIEYKKNPARPGTPRYKRFEKYKVATTIGAARRLGATSQDTI